MCWNTVRWPCHVAPRSGRTPFWSNGAGWPVEQPRGSMFLWAAIPERFRAAGSLEFAKLVLEKAAVAVSPGIGFGPLGEGHVRFALVENEQRIRQATRAIGQFLKS